MAAKSAPRPGGRYRPGRMREGGVGGLGAGRKGQARCLVRVVVAGLWQHLVVCRPSGAQRS